MSGKGKPINPQKNLLPSNPEVGTTARWNGREWEPAAFASPSTPIVVGPFPGLAADTPWLAIWDGTRYSATTLLPSSIAQGGAALGDALTWDGAEWGPAAPSGGGGGSMDLDFGSITVAVDASFDWGAVP